MRPAFEAVEGLVPKMIIGTDRVDYFQPSINPGCEHLWRLEAKTVGLFYALLQFGIT